jgi:hypothetical protein
MLRAFATFLIAVALTNSAFATCPLLDTIEYRGKAYPLAKWTNAPHNEKVNEWIKSLPLCSAMGQGRAVYRIEDDKVFLIMFSGCGPKLSVSEAFSQPEPVTLATWLNGRIDVARGSCMGGWDPAAEYFVVENGRLVEFHQSQ